MKLISYLSVDRSAMSHELCKMKKEGMLEFQKNQFRLMSDQRFLAFSPYFPMML